MRRRTGRAGASTRPLWRLLPTLALLSLLPLLSDHPDRAGVLGSFRPGGDGAGPGGDSAEVLGENANRAGPGSFRLSGSITAPMLPGARRPLDVVIENPNDSDLEVTTISVVIGGGVHTRGGKDNPDCRVDRDNPAIVVERAFVGPVVVPARRTASLSELAVPPDRWPVLAMPDLPWRQDACRDSVFPLVLTGSGRVS